MLPVRYSLRQLGYFIAVAERGSVRAAAEAMNVSPTALTQALNELEKELGTTLLHRQRAVGARLTVAGANLLGQARVVMDAAGDLQSLASAWEREPAGHLAVGCYSSLAPFLAARLLKGLAASHPAIKVEFRDGTQEDVKRELREGRTEIALLYEHGLEDDLAHQTLYRLEPHVILPHDHRLAGEDQVALADLKDDPFVLYDASPAGANTIAIFAHAGLRPAIGRRSANFEMVRSLVGAGFGYSVLLHQPLSDTTHDGGKLVRRRIRERTRDFAVVAAWPRAARPTRRGECLLAFCRAEGAWLGPQQHEGRRAP